MIKSISIKIKFINSDNSNKNIVVNKISFKPTTSLDKLVKSKYLNKSRQSGRDKELPSEIDVSEQQNQIDEPKLSMNINDVEKSDSNYFKMPVGNTGFKFNFNVQETTE